MKIYDAGLIVMRGQSLHNGHVQLINLALSLCDRVVIEVGSAQESGTLRNPFNISTRMEMLREVYPQSNVIIRALPDLTHEGDITTEWGDHIMKDVHSVLYKNPDVIIYGNEGTNIGTTWFSKETMADMTEVVVSRSTIPINATMMRNHLMMGRYDLWIKNTPMQIHKYVDRLRGELMATEPYKELFKESLNV